MGENVQSWEVTVRINGDDVLTIGHNHLSGIENIGDYSKTVELAGRHLLSFMGVPAAEEGGLATVPSGSASPGVTGNVRERFVARQTAAPDTWRVYGEFACINGLSAWFTIATVDEPDESEVGYTDGAIGSARQRAQDIAKALNTAAHPTVKVSGDAAEMRGEDLAYNQGLIAYLRTGETSGVRARSAHPDGGYMLPWIGNEVEGEKLAELYAMPAATSVLLDDEGGDLRAWIRDEVLPTFTQQLEAYPGAVVGPGKVLRDPYSAKPYVLFYVTAPAIRALPLTEDGPVLSERLTKTQRLLLERAKRDTFSDNSGVGAHICDGVELLIARRLESKGYASIGLERGQFPFGPLKITDAGRAALAVSERDGAPR